MNKLFNLDNPVFQFLNKVADMMILNFIFIILCIPVVTIGASLTAMYSIMLKLVKDEEGYVVKDFFKSFKANFKQATILWMILLVVGIMFLFDIQFFNQLDSGFGFFLSSFFKFLCIIYAFVFIYTFPLIARFINTNKQILINSFVMALKHLPSTIALVAIQVIAFLAVYFYPISIMIVFAANAYLSSFFLRRVFDKYLVEEENEKIESEE